MPITFLKLGGSLITDKHTPHTVRGETLRRLAVEIAAAQQAQPGLRLVLGHGSGSFGHVPARRYGTRQGVRTPDEWLGFVAVWREASELNRLVMAALGEAGLPAVAFSPAASVLAEDGQALRWDLGPIQAALAAGLLPVVYGDVVFDTVRGGTILSTEDLFDYLAAGLRPERLLLAGIEPGVWADFPACTRLLGRITAEDLGLAALGGSAATDVTGGMESKVRRSLGLAQRQPGLEVRIFSGEEAGTVRSALLGAAVGTRVGGEGERG